MAEHDLKTWPEYWAAIESGAKTFEVRRDDRDFQLGDTLLLREWDPESRAHTGREIRQRVTYVLRDADEFGVKEGFAVLGMVADSARFYVYDGIGNQIGTIPREEWCRDTQLTSEHEGPHSCDLRQGHDDTVHHCPCGADWLL